LSSANRADARRPEDAAALSPAEHKGGAKPSSLALSIAPIAGVVFVAFFVIGLAMPVLPLHVHGHLGLSTFVVGLVSGSQFMASLISRFGAGRYADQRGAKRAVMVGLVVAAVAGLFYLASLRLQPAPVLSAAVLVLGRGVLGAAESFIITGALGWGVALGGPENAGKVMAWMGLPMYAAFALGAPVGSSLYAHSGFAGVAVATAVAPLLALVVVAPLVGVAPSGRGRPDYRSIWGAVRTPGLGLALSSAGFGAITIFIALLFAQRGWSGAWGAFSALGVAFILARLVLGQLPDRFGGGHVALISIVVEAGGQSLIWSAATPMWAYVGAALTGLGYSLVYPALGVEAVRRAPPQSRALVMGAYTACLDMALGVTGPVLGLLASVAGARSVFLASGMIVLCGAPVALRLKPNPKQRRAAP
jgi:MFS family permease